MNGFPLVILGAALIVLAYVLWKIRSKVGVITGAIDTSFMVIEDGIDKNILDPTGPFGGVVNQVDQSFGIIEKGLNEKVLGPIGIVSVATAKLDKARDVFFNAGTYIDNAKNMLDQNIQGFITGSATIVKAVGTPFDTVSTVLKNIGDFFDQKDPFGGHPLQPIAQPFYDIGGDFETVNTKCQDLGDRIVNDLTVPVAIVSEKLGDLKNAAQDVGSECDLLSDYTKGPFTSDVTASVNELKTARASLNGSFLAFRTGVNELRRELERARTYLDSQLLMLVDQRMIMALAAAGVILIITGILIGF